MFGFSVSRTPSHRNALPAPEWKFNCFRICNYIAISAEDESKCVFAYIVYIGLEICGQLNNYFIVQGSSEDNIKPFLGGSNMRSSPWGVHVICTNICWLNTMLTQVIGLNWTYFQVRVCWNYIEQLCADLKQIYTIERVGKSNAFRIGFLFGVAIR